MPPPTNHHRNHVSPHPPHSPELSVVVAHSLVVEPPCLCNVMPRGGRDGIVPPRPGHIREEFGHHPPVSIRPLDVLSKRAPAVVVRGLHVVQGVPGGSGGAAGGAGGGAGVGAGGGRRREIDERDIGRRPIEVLSEGGGELGRIKYVERGRGRGRRGRGGRGSRALAADLEKVVL